MIKQAAIGLNSRSEANTFNEDGFLPLITAPMYSVVDESNYQVFLDNKIQVCLPRGNFSYSSENRNKNAFYAISLNDFIQEFITDRGLDVDMPVKVCIDTANGNMPALHEAIKKAKEIHGDSLIIMAGNVASAEAFVELAKTGVDYIRVGIGGGGGCNTTSNTGIGQENLDNLIHQCNYLRRDFSKPIYEPRLHNYPFFGTIKRSHYTEKDLTNIHSVKIVADGISSYINYCQKEYGFNDNGYAAINKLLFAGADLVMIGKLFAQCVESAGEKGIFNPNCNDIRDIEDFNVDMKCDVVGDEYKSYEEYWKSIDTHSKYPLMVKYSGMSTQEEQLNYKPLSNTKTGFVQLKPSEGSVSWISVRWTLNEWLNGSKNQDEFPYLMGWVNSIRSAMSYTGKKNLR